MDYFRITKVASDKIAEIKAIFPTSASYTDLILKKFMEEVDKICFNDYVNIWVNYGTDIGIDGIGGTDDVIPCKVDIRAWTEKNGVQYTKTDTMTISSSNGMNMFDFTIKSDEDSPNTTIRVTPIPDTNDNSLNTIILYEPHYMTYDGYLGNPTTWNLNIPDSHNDVYEHYVIGRIKELRQQPDYPNFYSMFEKRMKDLKKFYNLNAPMSYTEQVTPY